MLEMLVIAMRCSDECRAEWSAGWRCAESGCLCGCHMFWETCEQDERQLISSNGDRNVDARASQHDGQHEMR